MTSEYFSIYANYIKQIFHTQMRELPSVLSKTRLTISWCIYANIITCRNFYMFYADLFHTLARWVMSHFSATFAKKLCQFFILLSGYVRVKFSTRVNFFKLKHFRERVQFIAVIFFKLAKLKIIQIMCRNKSEFTKDITYCLIGVVSTFVIRENIFNNTWM